ncbi:hypothetical protein JTY93_18715 [Pseudomonas hygromyciniae]|uniref:DUF4760 domain-containing protein n=1 Tax=Pseudomonas hygromyciniae TaxID=2812000 RepID=A0ABX7JSC7_9PSED|nr:hypothetical protein [Pseudomonas hygromyciniae]MBN0978113.1 hypothetical protein [Pseudomonas hygromyciniae]QSB38291.1 hypothetical protein JTY93_18715 [Pseudomonas hygromyciniae]
MKLSGIRSFLVGLITLLAVANTLYFFIADWKLPSGFNEWSQYGACITATLFLYLAVIPIYTSHLKKNEDEKRYKIEKEEEAKIAENKKQQATADEKIALYRKEANRFVSQNHIEGKEAFKQFREDFLSAIEPFIASINGHIPEKLRNQYCGISQRMLTGEYSSAVQFVNATLKIINDLEDLQETVLYKGDLIEALKLEIKQDELLVFMCWYISELSTPEKRASFRRHKLLNQCVIPLPNSSVLGLTGQVDLMREMGGRQP